MIDNLATEGLATALGLVFLYVFYRAVQLDWPESYFGATEISAYAISLSPVRYALFRLCPVYVTALFAAVTVNRAGGDGNLTALYIGLGHALLTSGWGLIQAARWPASVIKNRIPVLLLRSVMLVAVIFTALAASASITVLSPLIPTPSEISATIWTGIIAGILGVYFVRISKGHAANEGQVVAQARTEIPKDLWILAAKEALDSGADVELTRSIMIVEHIQRPRWFRKLERIKGFVFRKGSYGIMQISSDHPLNDRDSIKKSCPRETCGYITSHK